MPPIADTSTAVMGRADIDSLLDWWRAAGVDVVVDEAPCNWLSTAGAMRLPTATPRVGLAAPVASAAPAPRPDLPTDLDAFRSWLATDATRLADHPPRRRLAPTGPTGGLMIVTDMPERGDTAGALLTGDAGVQFDLMLKAMKLDRAAIYLAPFAPSRPPTGMIAPDDAADLAEIMRHHITLVRPTALWLMGHTPSRALLGMDAARAGGQLHDVNLNSSTVVTIATLHPRDLRTMPNLKAAAWKDMQALMGRIAS